MLERTNTQEEIDLDFDLTIRLRRDDGSFKTKREIDLEVVAKIVCACKGNVSMATRTLRMGRSTFYRGLLPASRCVAACTNTGASRRPFVLYLQT